MPSIITLLILVLQTRLCGRLRELAWIQRSAARTRTLRILTYALGATLVVLLPLLVMPGVTVFSSAALTWMLAGIFLWLLVLLSLRLWVSLHRTLSARAERINPGRRAFLRVAAPTVALAPAVLAASGATRAQLRPALKETLIRVKGLHPDLNGLRIAQLTDIHYGPFFGRASLERAVAMANETKPHITLVTGDLITRYGDDLEGCLQALRGIRAEAGIWACHGNHEVYARAVELATELGERQGIHYLRGAKNTLRFGGGYLNLAGIDYPLLPTEALNGAEDLLETGATNVLLSHTPAVFDQAAELGFDLTLSGHTHGGQLNLALGDENITLARVYSPYIKGLYEKDGKRLYVSSGLGTVGVPVRLGADPEVTLIRLCAT
jgi:predicted MPP superfamily phosphohydrolase